MREKEEQLVKTMNRLLAAVLVLAWVSAASAQGSGTIRLTIASSHPPVIPWVAAMKNTLVSKSNQALEANKSKYRIEWNEAYGGVLYNFENTLTAVEQGVTDFGWVGTLWEPAKMPLQNIWTAVPFATEDPLLAAKVMAELTRNNPAFKKEWDAQNAVFFSPSASDSYQLFTKFPVRTLEDLKGKKILGATSVGPWIGALGATHVVSAIPTMYNMVQTGVGEGVMVILTGAIPVKLPEVAPYIAIVELGAGTFGALAANKRRWEGLPAEVRQTLQPLAEEYAAETIRIVKERERAGLAQLTKDGAKVYVLPQEERRRWAAAMPNLAKSWVEANEKKGLPARQIMKDFMEALRQAGAKPLRDWDREL